MVASLNFLTARATPSPRSTVRPTDGACWLANHTAFMKHAVVLPDPTGPFRICMRAPDAMKRDATGPGDRQLMFNTSCLRSNGISPQFHFNQSLEQPLFETPDVPPDVFPDLSPIGPHTVPPPELHQAAAKRVAHFNLGIYSHIAHEIGGAAQVDEQIVRLLLPQPLHLLAMGLLNHHGARTGKRSRMSSSTMINSPSCLPNNAS